MKKGVILIFILLLFNLNIMNSLSSEEYPIPLFNHYYEATPLFSGGTKIYVNDDLNKVKSILTDAHFPILLSDGSFYGNVDASYVQTILIGSDPKVIFAKQPTSSNDPHYALAISTVPSNYIYNLTVIFNKAVNFSNPDSKEREIVLFGRKFVVGPETDADTLVLLEDWKKLTLDSQSLLSNLIIENGKYNIELISASDTSATIKVTNNLGVSDTRVVSKGSLKIINGLNVYVKNVNEQNSEFSAEIIVFFNKIIFEDGSVVQIGNEKTVIEGTLVDFGGSVENMISLTISVYAPNSDNDSIENEFIDPVFNTFRLSSYVTRDSWTCNQDNCFSNLEEIIVMPDIDKMKVVFNDYRNTQNVVSFAMYDEDKISLKTSSDGYRIIIQEGDVIHYQDYVVVGNEDEGYLLRVSTLKNQSSGYSSDAAKFTDVFSGDVYETTWTKDGSGTLSVGGKSYTVTMMGLHTSASEDYKVRIDYPDSSSTNEIIIYPNIETLKGAKIMFYEPLTLSLTNWDGKGNSLSKIKIPNGDGYSEFGVVGGDVQAGRLNYKFANDGNNLLVNLKDVDGNIIDEAALIIFEEKDDRGINEAMIVKLEGGTLEDGIGVESVDRTWGGDSSEWESTVASDTYLLQEADRWGTIVTLDYSDSDQGFAVINYPSDQTYVQSYINHEFVGGCSDTDSWRDYYKKGTMTYFNFDTSSLEYGWNQAEDFCIDTKILTEYYCEGYKINHECSNICDNGICVLESKFVSLKNKWNLISWLAFNEIMGGEMNNPNIKSAFLYDRYNKKYIQLYPDFDNENFEIFTNTLEARAMENGADEDFNPELGGFYNSPIWVYSNRNQEIEFTVPEENMNLPYNLDLDNVGLSPGWNFLMVSSDMIGMSLNEWKGNCLVETAAIWSEEQQGWDIGVDDDFNDKFSEEMLWKGFAIRVIDNCTLGESGVLNPPELPDAPEDICYDSDGGDNENQRGIIHGIRTDNVWDYFGDYCGVKDNEKGKLVEFVCDGNYIQKILHDCINGCDKDRGVCLKYILEQDFGLIKFNEGSVEEGETADIVDFLSGRFAGFVNGASGKYRIENVNYDPDMAVAIAEFNHNLDYLEFKDGIEDLYLGQEGVNLDYDPVPAEYGGSGNAQVLFGQIDTSTDKERFIVWVSEKKLIFIIAEDYRAVDEISGGDWESFIISYLSKYPSDLILN